VDLHELGPGATTMVRQRPRRKAPRRSLKWLLWISVLIGLGAIATLSYRNKQPRALYGYLQRKHWDKPIDQQVQRLIVQPYRSIAKRVTSSTRKTNTR
jgi:hypothetical protein